MQPISAECANWQIICFANAHAIFHQGLAFWTHLRGPRPCIKSAKAIIMSENEHVVPPMMPVEPRLLAHKLQNLAT